MSDYWREWIALKLAPWLRVSYRVEREEAFRDLAEVAYLSRDAVWTSPRTLVRTALAEAARRGAPRLQRAVDKAHAAMIGSQYVGGPTEREAWLEALAVLSEVATQHIGQGPS